MRRPWYENQVPAVIRNWTGSRLKGDRIPGQIVGPWCSNWVWTPGGCRVQGGPSTTKHYFKWAPVPTPPPSLPPSLLATHVWRIWGTWNSPLKLFQSAPNFFCSHFCTSFFLLATHYSPRSPPLSFWPLFPPTLDLIPFHVGASRLIWYPIFPFNLM